MAAEMLAPAMARATIGPSSPRRTRCCASAPYAPLSRSSMRHEPGHCRTRSGTRSSGTHRLQRQPHHARAEPPGALPYPLAQAGFALSAGAVRGFGSYHKCDFPGALRGSGRFPPRRVLQLAFALRDRAGISFARAVAVLRRGSRTSGRTATTTATKMEAARRRCYPQRRAPRCPTRSRRRRLLCGDHAHVSRAAPRRDTPHVGPRRRARGRAAPVHERPRGAARRAAAAATRDGHSVPVPAPRRWI